MDFVDQLKSSVDIVSVVGEFVRLRKSSANSYKGLAFCLSFRHHGSSDGGRLSDDLQDGARVSVNPDFVFMCGSGDVDRPCLLSHVRVQNRLDYGASANRGEGILLFL